MGERGLGKGAPPPRPVSSPGSAPHLCPFPLKAARAVLSEGRDPNPETSVWGRKARAVQAGQQEGRKSNFPGMKANGASNLYSNGNGTGTEITVQQQNLSPGSAEPRPRPMATGPGNLAPRLSSFTAPPAPLPQLSRNLSAHPGRRRGAPQGARLPPATRTAASRSRRPCHPPRCRLRSPPHTVSDLSHAQPLVDGEMGASGRVQGWGKMPSRFTAPAQYKAQGPDSPGLPPSPLPEGLSTSSDDWVGRPL